MRMFPISRHLSKACGRKVQQALLKRGADSEDMSMGQVEMTDPGELRQFKRLMFICLRSYRDGNEKYLQQSLQECLELAATLGHTTVAVPALGTGGLNYPPEEVAQATVDAVFLHNMQHGETSSVQTVNIVLLDQDVELIKTYLRICASGSANLSDSEKSEINMSGGPEEKDQSQQATGGGSSSRPSRDSKTGASNANPQGNAQPSGMFSQAVSGFSSLLGSFFNQNCDAQECVHTAKYVCRTYRKQLSD